MCVYMCVFGVYSCVRQQRRTLGVLFSPSVFETGSLTEHGAGLAASKS